MAQRKISTIRFFLEKVSEAPVWDECTGYHKINGEWFRDRMEIDGVQPNCPAIDIKEFHRMLSHPGNYDPFTCTCGNSGCADIDFYVRCLHKDDLIIMVCREPLQRKGPCKGCKFENDETLCPAEHIYWDDCPFLTFSYRAYIFQRENIETELLKLEKSYIALGTKN